MARGQSARSSTRLRPGHRVDLLHPRADPHLRRVLPGLGRHHLVLLRGGGVRRRRQPRAGQGAVDQQDRPRHPRPRPGLRRLQPPARHRRRRRVDRLRRPPAAAVDVHLQVAPHRRRGHLPPGLHVPLHRPHDRGRASGSRSRTPRWRTAASGPSPAATAARCASASCATPAGGTDFEVLDATPFPEPGGRDLVPARGPGRHAGAAPRAAPPLERRQPQSAQSPCLYRSCHRRDRAVPRRELVAASASLPLRGFAAA